MTFDPPRKLNNSLTKMSISCPNDTWYINHRIFVVVVKIFLQLNEAKSRIGILFPMRLKGTQAPSCQNFRQKEENSKEEPACKGRQDRVIKSQSCHMNRPTWPFRSPSIQDHK